MSQKHALHAPETCDVYVDVEAMAPLSSEIVMTSPSSASLEALDGDVLFTPIVSLRTGRCWALAVSHASAELEERQRAYGEARGLGLALQLDPAEVDATLAIERLGDALGDAPGKVAIELACDPGADVATLARAADACRRAGFLVATTEIGVGHPHVDRVVALAPDVVKIDARLFEGVATSPARLEACRAVTELARSIGALMIANGVTSAVDLVELALLGIDLFEGDLVGRPTRDPARGAAEAAVGTKGLRALLRERAEDEVKRRRAERAVHERVFVAVMSRIAQARVRELDATAATIVRDVDGLEALYVLDQKGVQLTETWLSPSITPRGGFEPAERGADLGLKDYFLEVGHGQGAYVSRPYVSMASGRVSVTHSRRLRLCDGTHVVVCCDVPSAERPGDA